MTLDFTPAPHPAPRASQVWRHARMEAGLILRNGEQLLLGLVIPLGILVGGWTLRDRVGMPFATLAPSVVGVVLWSSGLTTLAIATGFERRYNVLERLTATPLGKGGVLLGKGLSIVMVALCEVLVVAAVALGMGWRPALAAVPWLVGVATALVGLVAFTALGLAIAGSLRPETTLALANLLFLVGMPLGLVVPVAAFPGWAQWLVQLLPTAAVGEALRAAGDGVAQPLPLLVAACWAVGASLLARKVFQWTS